MQATTLLVSDLIVKGFSMPDIVESHATYLGPRTDGKVKACAMGMAYAAFLGDPMKAAMRFNHRIFFMSPYQFFSEEMGIPAALAKKVSVAHINGTSAVGIAQVMREWTEDFDQFPTPERITREDFTPKPVVPTPEPKLGFFARCKAWWNRNRRNQPQVLAQLRLVVDNA